MPNKRSWIKWALTAAIVTILVQGLLLRPRTRDRAAEPATDVAEAPAAAPPDSSVQSTLAKASEPPAEKQQAAAVSSDDALVGVWEQQVFSAPGMLETLGTFAVTKTNGEYAMSPVEQSKASGVINSTGITNVVLKGDQWTFLSDWGGGRIGEFRLRRVNAKLFEGYAYFNGEVFSPLNRWVRIR